MDSFERCCRLCAREVETTIMIFGVEAVSMQLQRKLNKYLLIEIDEDDKLPKCICIQCSMQLNNVCEFIDSARNAQEILLRQSLILEGVIKTDNNRKTIPNIIRKAKRNATVVLNTEKTIEKNDSVTYLNTGDGENVTLTRLDSTSINVSKNIEEDDELDKLFTCNVCYRKYRSDMALKNHMWTHSTQAKTSKQYTCTICKMEYDFKNDFLAHLKDHKNSRKCLLCKRAFRSERNLSAHMVIHFSEKNIYTCDDCGRSYATKSSLKNHSITHSNERPYFCTICKKRFKRYQELKFHTNKHTGAKPFKCPDCDKCFSTSGNCYSHRIRMHPTARANKMAKQKQNLDSYEAFSFKPITPKPNANRNLPLHHLYKYQCQLCSHTFNKKDNFTYHMYKHTGVKPFHCIYCPEKFVTRRGHYLHYEKCHPAKDRPLALLSRNEQLK